MKNAPYRVSMSKEGDDKSVTGVFSKMAEHLPVLLSTGLHDDEADLGALKIIAQKALAQNPDNANANATLAQILFIQKEFETSLPHFVKAHAAYPDEAHLTSLYGDALFETQRYEESLPYLLSSLEKFPNDTLIQFRIGYSLFKAGLFEQAVPHVQESMKHFDDLVISEGRRLAEIMASALQRVMDKPRPTPQ